MRPVDSMHGDQPRTTGPWEVFRARRHSHPPNPLRYSHTIWLTLGLVALAALLTAVAIPARAVETEMLADARQAKTDGFPDLPPPHNIPSQITDFIEEWVAAEGILPPRSEIETMSLRMGEYSDDTAVWNVVIMGSLFALVVVTGIAFTRALNNLQALGHGTSVLSQAWVFASFFLPVLSFILPWRAVSEVFGCAWRNPEECDDGPRLRVSQLFASVWGLSFIGLWLLNPVTVNIFMPTGDIDEWINEISWTARMLAWLPVAAIITAVTMVIITWKQHARYRMLDRAAASA